MSGKPHSTTAHAGGFAEHSSKDRGCEVGCFGCLLCIQCGIRTHQRAPQCQRRTATALADLPSRLRTEPFALAIELSSNPKNRSISSEQQRETVRLENLHRGITGKMRVTAI